MKLKRILAAALAGVMAVTSSVVTSVTASAEEVVIKEISQSDIAISELANVTKVRVSFTLDTIGNEWATLTVYANNNVSQWQQETFAPTTAYNNGAGQDWQADNEITTTGSFSSTLDFTSTGSEWYQVGLKTTDIGLEPELTLIEFLDSSSSVVATYNPNAASIGVDNFTYSTLTNTSMAIGDTVKIVYDSTNTPVDAKYAIKYKVDNNGSTEYYAPVYNNALNGTEGETATGLKVTSSTSGAVTTYTFTAVAPSVGAFEINVETSVDNWTQTNYLWFGSATSYNVPAYTITTTSPTNGTLSVDKTTAAEGDTVTVTATPADGYELEAITVTCDNGESLDVDENNQFVMGDSNVTVAATFKAVEDEEALEEGTYSDGTWEEISAEDLAAAGALNTITTVGDEYLTTANVLSIQYSNTEKKLRIYKVYNEADLEGKSSASIVVKKGDVALKLSTECVYTTLADGQTAPDGCYYVAWVISNVDDPTAFSYSDITLA